MNCSVAKTQSTTNTTTTAKNRKMQAIFSYAILEILLCYKLYNAQKKLYIVEFQDCFNKADGQNHARSLQL